MINKHHILRIIFSDKPVYSIHISTPLTSVAQPYFPRFSVPQNLGSQKWFAREISGSHSPFHRFGSGPYCPNLESLVESLEAPWNIEPDVVAIHHNMSRSFKVSLAPVSSERSLFARKPRDLLRIWCCFCDTCFLGLHVKRTLMIHSIQLLCELSTDID